MCYSSLHPLCLLELQKCVLNNLPVSVGASVNRGNLPIMDFGWAVVGGVGRLLCTSRIFHFQSREQIKISLWNDHFVEYGRTVCMFRTEKIRKLVAMGIPESLRGKLWLLFSGTFFPCRQVRHWAICLWVPLGRSQSGTSAPLPCLLWDLGRFA